MFEVVNMDFAKRIDITDAQIAEVAAQIKQLESSLQNASKEQAEKNETKIARLQDEKIELQRQLAELYKRLPLSK